MKRERLTLTGYKSDTQVDGLMVKGERFLGTVPVLSRILQTSAFRRLKRVLFPTVGFSLNTCVIISHSFKRNMDNGNA